MEGRGGGGGGILLAGLPRLCERGYSLTPVDIAQSDHKPTEEQRTEPVNRNRGFLLPSLYVDEKRQKVHLRKTALPGKYKAA